MNILLIAGTIAKTGAGSHVKQLSGGLVNQSHKVMKCKLEVRGDLQTN